MDEIHLSKYGSASTTPSPVNRMMAAFAEDFREGVDVNLGMGYVSEEAIPHRWIRESLVEVIDRNHHHKAPFNYGGPAGSPNLVKALRRFYVKHRIGGLTAPLLDEKRIIVGVSGVTSILQAVAQILPVGLVITTDPLYYIYGELLQRAGFSLLTVPEDAEGIDTDRLEKKLAELGTAERQISFAYVATVANPTCTITSTARRRELVRIVTGLSRRIGRKVPLLLDTAYELLIHDPAVSRPESALLTDTDGIAYELGTLSKILAPALRVGYLIGPDGPFMDALVQNVSDIGFSAPLANQEIASRLLNEHVDEQIERVNAAYRRKATAMRGWIDGHLGRFVCDVRGGQAGFYFYLTFDDMDTREGSAFFRHLTRTTGDPTFDSEAGALRPRVLYLPGEYCVDRGGELVETGRRQLRLSYGFESLERIEPALRLMGEAATHLVARMPRRRRA